MPTKVNVGNDSGVGIEITLGSQVMTMTNDLLDEFFTPIGMLIYFLGIATACGWHLFKQYRSREDRINWTSVGIIVGVSALVFVGMQNTQLATEVKECQQEFNAALKVRNTIRETNDRLSREHRHWLSKSDEAVADLIRLSTAPPDPAIAVMERSDPRRIAYDTSLVVQYNLRHGRYQAEIDRIEKEQDANQREWDNHPLPDPECGKN